MKYFKCIYIQNADFYVQKRIFKECKRVFYALYIFESTLTLEHFEKEPDKYSIDFLKKNKDKIKIQRHL